MPVLEAPNESIKFCLGNLRHCARDGLECPSLENDRILRHTVISSYVASIPELKTCCPLKDGPNLFLYVKL